MSDIPKRSEYFLSPDGLRKLTQLMRNHFDSYPSKDKLYTDSKGLQYNGSIYNFGSEILLETHKLKMTRPPIRNLTYGNDTSFYFDIQYANLVDTYEQQNMLVCNLKRDVLVASHRYYLVFNNVSEYITIRSTNSSAGNRITPDSQKHVQQSVVFKDTFYKTNETPILVETYIDENDNEITINHELKIKDGKTYPTFYFHYNELTQHFIDSIYNNTLTTIDLVDEMFDLPFIWFTSNSFVYLPRFELSNNIDMNRHHFLTFGTDGNNIVRLYPNCYDDNFPYYEPIEQNKWFLKVECVDGYRFIPDGEPGDRDENYTIPIKSVSLIYASSINQQPDVENIIGFGDNPNVIIYIDNCKLWGRSDWKFNRRTGNDYDYDYGNSTYAYHVYESIDELNESFSMNHSDGTLRPGFKVQFIHGYRKKQQMNRRLMKRVQTSTDTNDWSNEMIGSTSGFHLDSSRDNENDGTDEKNGIAHEIGDFDGLPYYIHDGINDTIHKSHVEMYSIRDSINKVTQSATNKQTVGMIVDSAIPQNQLPSIVYTDPVIIYDTYESNLYYTDFSKMTSETNVLSDIVYVDSETNVFGDRTIDGMKQYQRFFYHGNNFFSLGISSMNPNDEYGRSYIATNDPSTYTNNGDTLYVKPSRTIAYICDIPTSIINLANVPDYAPSILIDWNDSYLSYVRMYCNYSTYDKTMILNDTQNLIKYNKDIIFPNDYDLTNVLLHTGDRYKITQNINRTMMLTFGENGNTEMSIVEHGSGFIDDTGQAKFNIGGRYFKIDFVASSGIVTSVEPHFEPNESHCYPDINLANLGNHESRYNTTVAEGHGSGLVIKLTIDENVWNQYNQYVEDEYRDGLYLYKYDEYNHIWLWTYDNIEHVWNCDIQITGTRIIRNPYDLNNNKYPTDKRKINDTYIMNLLNGSRKVYYQSLISSLDSMYNMDEYHKKINIPKTKVHLDDLSEDLNELNVNVQNTYYVITPDDESENSILDVHVRYPYSIQDIRVGGYHETILPRFNNLNITNLWNTSNRLMYSINRYKINSQPDVLFYNPNETNVVKYNNISSDYYTIESSHKMSLVDLIDDELDTTSNLYIAKQNVYRYNEYDIPTEYETLLNTFNGMTREGLISYIRETFGDNATPLLYENNAIQYSKKMLVDYCMIVTNVLYKKPNIKMVAQKYQNVAQSVEQDDGSTIVVPTIEDSCSGIMKSISSTISELDYHSKTIEFDSDMLFIFTIPKNDQLVSFKHFRMFDENNVDISTKSLLIYNGKKYLFNETNDNWYVVE